MSMTQTPPTRPKAPATVPILMDWFSKNLGKTVTIDAMRAMCKGANSATISRSISILTNSGWIITKPGNSKFVCHQTGSLAPDMTQTVRREEFKRVVRVQRPAPLREAPITKEAAVTLASQPTVTPPANPAPSTTVTVIQPTVIQPRQTGIGVGDLLEVVYVSRAGTAHVEDTEGRHYILTPFPEESA